MKHLSLESFSALDSGPLPLTGDGWSAHAQVLDIARIDLLQHAACVDKDIRLVVNHVLFVISPLDLDVPHLLIFIPNDRNHLVAQPDVLVEVVLFCHIFKVLQNLRSTRVTSGKSVLFTY